MADYWHTRYLDAQSKIHEAESSQARSAYMKLAAHYKAMRAFCDRGPVVEGYRLTA